MKKFREADLLAPLEIILNAEHPEGEVFVEVDNAPCGGRPDVVVRVGNKIIIYELKLSCNIKLLEQCITRRKSCNKVVAVVSKKLSSKIWKDIFRSYGIGLLIIELEKMDEYNNEYIEDNFEKFVKLEVNCKTNAWGTRRQYFEQTILDRWKKCLLPEMKIENGNNAGVNRGYLTQKKIYTDRYLSKFRVGRYYHPTDENIIRILKEYSSNPIQMSFAIIKENIHLFDVKTEGRKKYYKINVKFDHEFI